MQSFQENRVQVGGKVRKKCDSLFHIRLKAVLHPTHLTYLCQYLKNVDVMEIQTTPQLIVQRFRS